jgi:hypothetical protein
VAEAKLMTYKQQNRILTAQLWRHNAKDAIDTAWVKFKAQRDGKIVKPIALDADLRAAGLRVGDQFKLPQDGQIYEVVA